MIEIGYQMVMILLLLFMPGLLLSLVVFRKGEIGLIERVVMSFTFSIMIVSVQILAGGIVGVRITQLNLLLLVDSLLLIATLLIFIKRGNDKKR